MRGHIVLLAAVIVAAGMVRTPAGAAGSSNPRNDRLLAMTEAQQAEALSRSFRHGCVGVAAFPMGMTEIGRAKGYAYWSVRCKNGRSYVVQIPPNIRTPAIVADCKVLQGTGRECFKKF
ncbi:MAG TPA: hypothetical protein VL985_09165 [Stellaceae bacterium]|nr:hypothetical protein [Stellaceae bacterium]